jgi:hypothetical protein
MNNGWLPLSASNVATTQAVAQMKSAKSGQDNPNTISRQGSSHIGAIALDFRPSSFVFIGSMPDRPVGNYPASLQYERLGHPFSNPT